MWCNRFRLRSMRRTSCGNSALFDLSNGFLSGFISCFMGDFYSRFLRPLIRCFLNEILRCRAIHSTYCTFDPKAMGRDYTLMIRYFFRESNRVYERQPARDKVKRVETHSTPKCSKSIDGRRFMCNSMPKMRQIISSDVSQHKWQC